MKPALLSYNLASGTTYSYQVDMSQHIEMSTSGDSSTLGDQEFPGNASFDISGSATFTHMISDGPEPGTFEVNITGSFHDLVVSGTMDGKPMDEVPDFAGLEPFDVTFIVDEQGNLIVDDQSLQDPLGGALGDFSSLGSGGFGMDPGQFVGPPLSDGQVTVGDTWTETTETPMFGEDPALTTITSTVTGTDQLDGFDVLVIGTETTTSAINLDLGEFFIGLFGAFTPTDSTTADSTQLQELLDQFRFVISVDGATSNATTWFDPVAGVARKFDVDGSTRISMDVNLPDQTTGELVGFKMDMSVSQQLSYKLLDSSAT